MTIDKYFLKLNSYGPYIGKVAASTGVAGEPTSTGWIPSYDNPVFSSTDLTTYDPGTPTVTKKYPLDAKISDMRTYTSGKYEANETVYTL